MSRRYLLDTNILSDLIRHPQGRVFDKISQLGEKNIFTSIVVACELRFGAQKKASSQLTQRIECILSYIEVLPCAAPLDHHYALIRYSLEKKGTPIGPNDLLIAAHACSENAVLVSANLREFLRVPELKVESWL